MKPFRFKRDTDPHPIASVVLWSILFGLVAMMFVSGMPALPLGAM